MYISHEILEQCDALSKDEIKTELEQLTNNGNLQEVLKLKKGANVMCTANVDIGIGLCNGTQGNVVGFTVANSPIVKWNNGIETTMEIHYQQSEIYPSIAIGQYPLVLSWAMTIHRIQGATLDMAEIDLGSHIFEYAQSYVGLSRVKSLDGLYLSAFNANKIRANPIVADFYERIRAR
jgi:ATP-dependent DNA helicase PIF1